MENKLVYITPSFEYILKDLLVSTNTDLLLLHNYFNGKSLPDTFKLEIEDHVRRREFPLGKFKGFLLFDNKEILSEFVNVAKNSISTGNVTASGIANFLILIDCFGSMPDSVKDDAIQTICSFIPSSLYRDIVSDLISAFNRDFNFSDSQDAKTLSFIQWEEILYKVDYMEFFDNPIFLLRQIISFWANDLPILNIIDAMNPDTKVAYVQVGVNWDSINEEILLDHLKVNRSSSVFYGVLFSNSRENRIPPIGTSLARFLIDTNWSEVGRYIFRKVYYQSRREIDESAQNFFAVEIDRYLKKTFNNGKKNIIKELKWPEDFSALGGWLDRVFNDAKFNQSIKFEKSFTNHLCRKYLDVRSEIRVNIPDFISEKSRFYNYSFIDPFDVKIQYLYVMILWSIMIADDESYNDVIKEIKADLYQVKSLFYGAYVSQKLAEDISNDILSLLLAYPKFEEDKNIGEDRLISLIGLLEETIIDQWVFYSERSELIWNHNSYKPNITDANLLLVITKLKNPPAAYQKIVFALRHKIESIANVYWPWKNVTDVS